MKPPGQLRQFSMQRGSSKLQERIELLYNSRTQLRTECKRFLEGQENGYGDALLNGLAVVEEIEQELKQQLTRVELEQAELAKPAVR